MIILYARNFKVNQIHNKATKITFFFIMLMGLMLNHTNLIFRVNFSFADIICIMLLLIFIITGKIVVPVIPLIFFLIISFLVLFTSTFYVPFKYLYATQFVEVVSNYIKLLASFIYFLMGYNFGRYNYAEQVIKWFSIGSLLMGVIAVIFTIFNIKLFSTLLYESSIRFRGLMGDPNYFSLVQIGAMAYFANIKKSKNSLKYAALFILLISILISGSKTGVITFIAYFILFKVFDNIININIYTNYQKILLKVFIILLVISSFFILSDRIFNSLRNILGYIPSLDRVSLIFTDFKKAVSDSGSSRDITWNAAMRLIESSPVIGIGVGTYVGISTMLCNVDTVAHNTYLQLTVEWGFPLSVIFYIYIFILVAKVSLIKQTRTEINVIVRDLLFVFLFGSIAISLNNARMFWLFIGILLYGASSQQKSF